MSVIYCEHCDSYHDTDFVEMETASYLFQDYPDWKPLFQNAGYNAEWFCEAELEAILDELNLEY